MAELFGFRITRKKDEAESFTLPTSDDGAEDLAQGGFFSSVYDIEGRDKTQYDLIKIIRSTSPLCDFWASSQNKLYDDLRLEKLSNIKYYQIKAGTFTNKNILKKIFSVFIICHSIVKSIFILKLSLNLIKYLISLLNIKNCLLLL